MTLQNPRGLDFITTEKKDACAFKWNKEILFYANQSGIAHTQKCQKVISKD